MSEVKKVWMNWDNQFRIDMSYLQEELNKIGCELIVNCIESNDEESIIRQGKSVDVIISIFEKLNRKILKELSGNVKLIIKYGVGTDNIDLEAAKEYGIPVANTPGVNSITVAETILFHLLNLGRRMTYHINNLEQSLWTYVTLGRDLNESTIGIIGFGNISKSLIKLLKGFDVRIVCFSKHQKEYENVEFLDSIEDVFRQSDFVCINSPLTKENKGSINARLFSMMKKGSYIVNASRGGLINEDDLVEALRSGQLAGAGLDVMAMEPPAKDNPLLKMDNVFITPHIGSSTMNSHIRTQKFVLKCINELISGKFPETTLNMK